MAHGPWPKLKLGYTAQVPLAELAFAPLAPPELWAQSTCLGNRYINMQVTARRICFKLGMVETKDSRRTCFKLGMIETNHAGATRFKLGVVETTNAGGTFPKLGMVETNNARSPCKWHHA